MLRVSNTDAVLQELRAKNDIQTAANRKGSKKRWSGALLMCRCYLEVQPRVRTFLQ